MKCAKLLALSVLSAESSVRLRVHGSNGENTKKSLYPVMDEGDITKVSSKINCDKILSCSSTESIVYFGLGFITSKPTSF
jgi:hydrogenase maturation factor